LVKSLNLTFSNELGTLFLKDQSNQSKVMVSDGISDAECVRRLQRGETNAFEILVRRHEKTIFNLVYRMLGDYDEAAEISQEVFLSAFRAVGQFRGESNFSTWLYRIALNHASTRRKSLGTRQQKIVSMEKADPLSDPLPGPPELFEKQEVRERVQLALKQLDPEDAAVILLRDLQDVPYDEVARVLEIPVGTVKSRLHRARQALKSRLAPYFCAGRKAV
jgi:RNA polymerase sigma-70 factor, ECF subfamily